MVSIDGLLVVVPARDEEALIGRCLGAIGEESVQSGPRGPISTWSWSWWRTVAWTARRMSPPAREHTSYVRTWGVSAPHAGWVSSGGRAAARRTGRQDVGREHGRRHPRAPGLAGSPTDACRPGRPARRRSRGAGPRRPGRVDLDAMATPAHLAGRRRSHPRRQPRIQARRLLRSRRVVTPGRARGPTPGRLLLATGISPDAASTW